MRAQFAYCEQNISDGLNYNLVMRPYARDNVNLVQLDDLNRKAAERVMFYSFLIIETSPGNFQAWLAVKDDRLWQDFLHNTEVKPSTEYGYNSELKNHLNPVFGNVSLADITPHDLTHFFKVLKEEAAPKYALNIYGLLNTMFEVAAQHDLIESIPLQRKLHRPKYQPKEKVVLSAATIWQIIQNVPNDYSRFSSWQHQQVCGLVKSSRCVGKMWILRAKLCTSGTIYGVASSALRKRMPAKENCTCRDYWRVCLNTTERNRRILNRRI